MTHRIPIRSHMRRIKGVWRLISASSRVIGDVMPVVRQRRSADAATADLFESDFHKFQDIARQPDGGEITGQLLELARQMRE